MAITSRSMTLLLEQAVLALAVLTGVATGVAHAQSPDRTQVERLTFPVPGPCAGGCKVVGYLYHDGTPSGRPLQVLVHGGTYDHQYWDLLELNGRAYSYARYMVRRQYTVLAIDQLGAGESSRPDGDALTVDVASAAVDQVVRAMRGGQNALGLSFERIALVGHSLGSNVSIHAQGSLRTPVDALVSTGLGHVAHELPLPEELVDRALDAPYWHMTPAERTASFFHAPEVDPDMVAYDNARFTHPISRGIFLTAMARTFEPAATKVDAVNVPVLVQLADHDVLFGSAYADGEAALWSAAPEVTVQRLENIGHCYNSHLTRHESWRGIASWLGRVLARAHEM
ncbi:alpha/beta fold hydrolase [Pyxidicoccus fallax]|uniref:Alpha/beta hydrolase n=1 Tax=Pyxidicoccus fallax TaxID=394095 RepID=A0A848LAR1_9BACT|nr:alpha/beta fold hydrolase [Pyxidicoccus fallax]NMO15707.1 alpha/beta hydrolase [Pyxidicoccus fallax]NPC77114.1 alpha/beta fold hydrolase [Pyxidicoccus fallax]